MDELSEYVSVLAPVREGGTLLLDLQYIPRDGFLTRAKRIYTLDVVLYNEYTQPLYLHLYDNFNSSTDNVEIFQASHYAFRKIIINRKRGRECTRFYIAMSRNRNPLDPLIDITSDVPTELCSLITSHARELLDIDKHDPFKPAAKN